MPTATFVRQLGSWVPETRLYRLSEPLDGYHHVAVTVPDTQWANVTEVHPADETGLAVRDPAAGGLAPHRRYEGLSHKEALAEIGYEVTDGADD